jgi:integrase
MRGCRPLTEPEVDAVLAHMEGPGGARDRALFLLGIRSGFRISEILSLRLCDVVQAGQVVERVRVMRRHMKGKREGRTVLLHPAARAALSTWLEELQSAGYMTADSFVFQSRRGPNQAIGRVQAWRILRRAFAWAGLTGNLGTHSMRKTFANRIYERLDGDLVKTAQALAHRSISSTASYLTFRESEIDDAILSI